VLLLILFQSGFSTEKAQCVLWLSEAESPDTVQRKFRAQYGNNPPDVKLIKSWKTKFLETGSVHKDKSSGRPSVSDPQILTLCLLTIPFT
jgi:hypothetical protein